MIDAARDMVDGKGTLVPEHTVPDRYGWLACPDEYQLPKELLPAAAEQASMRILGYYDEPGIGRMFAHIRPIFGDPDYGLLTLAEREFIGVVVSAVNSCVTCLIIHVHRLGELIGDHGRARRISINYRAVSLSAEERGIADFCVKATEQPGRLEEADLQRLRNVGLSDAKIYYVVQIAAAFNFTNRMTSAYGMRPDDDFLDKLAPSVLDEYLLPPQSRGL